jgi:hypothetical protein
MTRQPSGAISTARLQLAIFHEFRHRTAPCSGKDIGQEAYANCTFRMSPVFLRSPDIMRRRSERSKRAERQYERTQARALYPQSHCRTPAGKGVAQAVACSAPEDWVSDRWSCGTGRQVLHAVELHAVSSIDHVRPAAYSCVADTWLCAQAAIARRCSTSFATLCCGARGRTIRLQRLGRDRSLNERGDEAGAALIDRTGSSARVNQMLLSMAIVADQVDTLTPAVS